MKRSLALLLSAVLLLSLSVPAAFAVEYTDTYETAISLAKNDLSNLDSLSDAIAMLGRLGSYSFSKRYVLYFRYIMDIQDKDPDLEEAELMFDLCRADGRFTADLEKRELPSCDDLLSYIEARKKEKAGDHRGAFAIYSGMSILDTTERATDLALRFPGSLELKGHNWNAATYSWSTDHRSCTAKRTCLTCGAVETEKANAVSSVTRQATCTTAGETTYTVHFANTAFSDRTETVRGAFGSHDWNSPDYRWSSGYGSCTAVRVCRVCGTRETETATSKSSVTTQPTCTAKGVTTYSVSFKNSAFQPQYERDYNIAMKPHSWTAATYYSPKTCTVCGKTEGSPLTAPVQQTPTYTAPSSGPSSADLAGFSKLSKPGASEYFGAYYYGKVKSTGGYGIYAYYNLKNSGEHFTILEGTPVTLIGYHGDWVCVTENSQGYTRAGWVNGGLLEIYW